MAADPLRDQLLASLGYPLPSEDSPTGGLADQIAALQGLGSAPTQAQDSDFFQPVRTFFGATGGIGGHLIGTLAPEAYQQAQQEVRQARGITDQSPWYERVEALPTAGDVAAAGMSPEFRASGVGRVVEPVTRIVGGILGDPTTYLGGIAGKAAGGVAARVAPELVDAARLAEATRATALAAGTLTPAAARAAQATEAAEIAARVLSEGSALERGVFHAGTGFLKAEPLALAAPAALAYGPETIRTIYEQARGIPESEHPVADAVSVALLGTLTALMGKGLLDAGRAVQMWHSHAADNRLAPDVVAQGEDQIAASVQEAAATPAPPAPTDMPVVEGTLVPPTVTRIPAGIPTAEPITGVRRVADAGVPSAEPIPGLHPVLPEVPESAVSLVAEPELPVLPESDVRIARGPAPKNMVKPLSVEPAPEAPPAPPAPPAAPEPPPAAAPAPKPEPPPTPPAPAAAAAEPPITPPERTIPVSDVAATQEKLSALEKRINDANLTDLEQKILTRKMRNYLTEEDAIQQGNDAMDEIMASRAKRTEPAPTQDLEAALKASLGAKSEGNVQPTVTKAEPSPAAAAPEPAPPVAPKPPTPEPTVAPATETPRAEAPLSAGEAQRWAALESEVAGATAKKESNRLLLKGAQDKLATMTADEKREWLRQLRENYRGDKTGFIKGHLLGLDVKKGEQIAEGTAAKVTAPVEMGVTKTQTVTKGEGFDAARAVLKKHNLTLRQFMDDPESGPLTFTPNKGGGRAPVTHDLRDTGTKIGKLWNRYVDYVDSGKLDAAYQRILAKGRPAAEAMRLAKKEAVEAVAKAEGMAPTTASNIIGAGRKALQVGTLKKYGEGETETPPQQVEAAPPVKDAKALQAQKAKADLAATNLGKQVEAIGGLTPEVLQNPEFKDSVRSTLEEMARHLVATRGMKLGPRDPLRSLEPLRALASKLGIPDNLIARNASGEEILQRIADKVGLDADYQGAVRGQLHPQPRQTAVWKPTLLHPGEVVGGKEGFVYHVSDVSDPAVLAQDIVNNPEMRLVAFGEKVRGKQVAALEAALPEGFKITPREGAGETLTQAYEIQRPRIETMAARRQVVITVDGVDVDLDRMAAALEFNLLTDLEREKWDTFTPQLAAELKKIGVTGFNEADFKAGTQLGQGTFHAAYALPGARGPNGESYILRVGRSPFIPLVSDAQKALVQQPAAKGLIGHMADPSGRVDPYFWTLHQQGHVPKKIIHMMADTWLIDKSGALSREMGVTGRYSDSLHTQVQQAVFNLGQLPPGMSLQEHLDASAELLQKMKAADLGDGDLRLGGLLRTDQQAWVEVPDGTTPSPNEVTRLVLVPGETEPRTYKLVVSDYGAVFPKNPPKGSVWEEFSSFITARIALKEANNVDNAAPRDLSMGQLLARYKAYSEDLQQGLALGDSKLVLANHDRVMSVEYLQKLQKYGERTATALEDIHDRLVQRILAAGRLQDGVRTRFVGLTASPHLSGLFQTAGRGEGHVFINPVEAVNFARTREGAIDEMLYSLFHEVSHAEATGHGAEFHDIYQYMKNLAEAEGHMDDYRRALGEAFTEDDFARMRDELVPDFKSARSKYGSEQWRAEDLSRVPSGDLESGTAPLARGPRGTAAGAEVNRAAGVRPGADVQGGGEGQARELRAGAAAAKSAAKGRAPGSADGSAAGRSAEASVLQRIEERASRGEAGIREDEAQVLMDKLIERSKTTLGPVKDVYRRGYEYARLVEETLTDAEREVLAKSLPSPRHPDQREGVINLLHSPDLDLRMKARIALMHKFTKKAWPRDKVRGFAEVGKEVQDVLGLHTPEEWTRIYKSKGGGLRDFDVELLRTVHNELAGDVIAAEDRLYEALQTQSHDGDLIKKLRGEVEHKERAWHHSMMNLSKGLTGVARALAIARHEVRALDPILRMDQDLRAGLLERMMSKYRDKAVAGEKADELLAVLKKVREDKNGDWKEFYDAYRAMLGSKLWPDKVLEFYKAGLLGYPSRVANIASNSLFRTVRYVEDAVAGALDAARVGVLGGNRERYAGETSVSALALSRALKEAFPDWWKAQGDAFALRPQDAEVALARGGLMEDMLMHPGAVGGKLGEFIRFPFKGLSSDDALAKHIARLDSMYRDIYRGIRSGEHKALPGESHAQATERIFTQLRDNFRNATSGQGFDFQDLKKYQQLATVAEENAARETFQADLGNFGRGMNWLLRNIPALQMIFPFVRTPTNIAKETLKRTPLGVLNVMRKWKDLSPGERITEFSKPAVGSLIGAGIFVQALTGDITGGGPVDPDELEALKATGWQPYSAKIGDQWISYQRLEPIAAIMGIAADAAEGLRNGDFQKWQDGTMRVLQSAAENVTNKTFLSGLDGMFSAVSHPKEYGARFVKQMQGSLVPNSLGFIPVSGMARALDPVYRHSDPFSMNVFYSKLPWLSSTLEPQYGPTGEERLRSGSALERVFSPFARTTQLSGPAAAGADEVVRLSAAPRAPGYYWTGKGGFRVDFLPEERQQLAKAYREATTVIGMRLVKDPNYQKLPDNENDPRYRYGMKTKKDVIQRLYGKYRDSVMDRLKPRLEARAVKESRHAGT